MCKWESDWSHQSPLIINGKQESIDNCLVDIIKALNSAGIKTLASCCGHGNINGIISLADGREFMILPDYETARKYDGLVFSNIQGE